MNRIVIAVSIVCLLLLTPNVFSMNFRFFPDWQPLLESENVYIYYVENLCEMDFGSMQHTYEAYKRGWIQKPVDSSSGCVTWFTTKQFKDFDSILSSLQLVEATYDFENKLVKFFVRKPKVRRVEIYLLNHFIQSELEKEELMSTLYMRGIPLEYRRPKMVHPDFPDLEFPPGPSPVFEHWALVVVKTDNDVDLDCLAYFDVLPPKPSGKVCKYVLVNPSCIPAFLGILVERKWMETNSVQEDSLMVMKLEDNQWTKTPHEIMSSDENGLVLFVPLSSHYSLLAVVGSSESLPLPLTVSLILAVTVALIILVKYLAFS